MHGWRKPTKPVGEERLLLDAVPGDDDPIADLSAAARHGSTLFLGSDEGVCIERLLRTEGGWDRHARIPLDSLLPFDAAGEADIEGLAEDGGWLWVLGSHARTRPRIATRDDERIDLADFAKLKDTRPRCLLARVPLAPDPALPGAMLPVPRDGDRRAGMLRLGERGNRLARLMALDPLLGPFTRVAAKEGGVDLEGIAVAGDRIAIGMRGPVIRTHAVLLECTLAAKPKGRLVIVSPLSKRLLALDGLGIRDLKRDGDDLLILAGPTTGLDGPCHIYRWQGWAGDPPRDAEIVRLHRPERIIDLPFGRGDDHPEGLLLLDRADGGRDVAVICDSPAKARMGDGGRSVRCDRFRLR